VQYSFDRQNESFQPGHCSESSCNCSPVTCTACTGSFVAKTAILTTFVTFHGSREFFFTPAGDFPAPLEELICIPQGTITLFLRDDFEQVRYLGCSRGVSLAQGGRQLTGMLSFRSALSALRHLAHRAVQFLRITLPK